MPRLDRALSEFLGCSRSAASSILKHKQVSHPSHTPLKPSLEVTPDFLKSLQFTRKFFSLGQLKLDYAWDHMPKTVAAVEALDFSKRVHLDVGCSTGGYVVSCLRRFQPSMQVFGVDTQRSGEFARESIIDFLQDSHQASWFNENLHIFEETDIRHFEFQAVPQQVGLMTVDVSLIPQSDFLPNLTRFDPDVIVSLVKPQYEMKSSVKSSNSAKGKKMREEAELRVMSKFEECFPKHQFLERVFIEWTEEVFVSFTKRIT